VLYYLGVTLPYCCRFIEHFVSLYKWNADKSLHFRTQHDSWYLAPQLWHFIQSIEKYLSFLSQQQGPHFCIIRVIITRSAILSPPLLSSVSNNRSSWSLANFWSVPSILCDPVKGGRTYTSWQNSPFRSEVTFVDTNGIHNFRDWCCHLFKTNFGSTDHHHLQSSPIPCVCAFPSASAILKCILQDVFCKGVSAPPAILPRSPQLRQNGGLLSSIG
jgi:hypothetical protein